MIDVWEKGPRIATNQTLTKTMMPQSPIVFPLRDLSTKSAANTKSNKIVLMRKIILAFGHISIENLF